MKFGLEAEKFLFNLHTREPSESVFSFLDGVSEYGTFSSQKAEKPNITNEFVLNMVEFGTTPSTKPLEVLKDYIFQYVLMKKVALREDVGLVPLASLPMDYLPHMTTKWGYYVQNSILSGKKQSGWMMNHESPLKNAGNCAGIHVHAEIQTAPEFLFANRELVNKFNLGIMLTPMIAFSSSPYFFGRHEALSMRGLAYYFETYRNFPLNGHLPDVMESSADVLHFFMRGQSHWIEKGTGLGFRPDDMEKLTRKGASWNPVRWNRTWNTIELRCLDSDSIELDCAKFLWVVGAMRRLDQNGEDLKCAPMRNFSKLDDELVGNAFTVDGNEVSILPSHAIQDLFERAVIFGTRDPLVELYLHRLAEFSAKGLNSGERKISGILNKVLETHSTSADWVLSQTRGKSTIDNEYAADIVVDAIARQEQILKTLETEVPDVFSKLETMLPGI